MDGYRNRLHLDVPVNPELQHTLIELDNRFYREHAASFAATRTAPWAGWSRVADVTLDALESPARLSVLDVACGTLRFERFLADAAPDVEFDFLAVDDCPELACTDLPIRMHDVDILGSLLSGMDPFAFADPCDLTVCFGFFHHIPGSDLRMSLLKALVSHTRPGGVIALSLWAFMDDARLARKSDAAWDVARAAGIPVDGLEEGDRFLGWQDDAGALRYCHHFSEQEADGMAAVLDSLGAPVIERFLADGKTGTLNRYLICRRS